jgi:NAD(P)-dependent dehydrogenase (short-subunit alcohol dehydrogenase family)
MDHAATQPARSNAWQPFRQKTVLVTGAGTGIGRATALAFASNGANVVLAGRNAARLTEVALAIEAHGGQALAVPTDVQKEADIARAVDAAIAAFGTLDIAFNNAGIGAHANLMTLEATDFDEVFATNVRGLWLSMKYELKAMTQQGGGAIINNLSVHSARTVFPGVGAYTASKHAGVALTQAAALEAAADGVRVNAIAPGPIATEMLVASSAIVGGVEGWAARIPSGRVGEPAEVAAAVMWLASSAASFINGVVLPVDGGFLAT